MSFLYAVILSTLIIGKALEIPQRKNAGFPGESGYDFFMIDEDKVIDEFTGGAPRADEWRALHRALTDKKRGVLRERAVETDLQQIAALDKQVAALERQIAVLQTEEVVAEFVEKSLQAALARAPGDLLSEDEEDGE